MTLVILPAAQEDQVQRAAVFVFCCFLSQFHMLRILCVKGLVATRLEVESFLLELTGQKGSTMLAA